MYSYIINKTKNNDFGRFENYMHFHERTEKDYDKIINCNTKEKEDTFWQKLYEFVFEEYGTNLDNKKESREFLDLFPQHKLKCSFPEVIEVLECCRNRKLFLGIISDSGPYLRDSIIPLGIDSYFSRYVASSEVGVMKPDPGIFKAAIKDLDIEPSECLFVDDTKDEADGARDFGFLSLYLNRKNKSNIADKWEINNLNGILSYL
jgi:HAD superfamily hydrolase (TIGR01509 family)